MAILTDLTDVYDALDAVLADAAGNGGGTATADETATVEKIVTYLKNRRGLLSEIVNFKADPAAGTYESGDADSYDHLG